MTITLKDVSVSLGEELVLESIGLSIDQGLSFILGLNGSGKTTLLNCLSKSVPYKGDISILGTSIQKMSPKEFARTVSIVHQKWSIPFRISVFDFVLMGRFPYLNWLGSYSKLDRGLVLRNLEQLQIEHLKNRFIDQVSGGELQRVFLCRALAQDSPIMLLDEPAQSLDPPGKKDLYLLLKKLAQKGKTIICTTHDIETLPLMGSQVIGIRGGKVVFKGKVDSLSPEVQFQIYESHLMN
ncbi:MAG: ABC transporter ATP-binding protein [Bacteroidota bacterium]